MMSVFRVDACLTLSLSLSPLLDRPGLGTFGFSHFVLGLTSPEGVFFFHIVVLRSRTSSLRDFPSTTATPVCDLLKTAHASFKDLRGAATPAHRHPGGSDCGPTAATHTHPHGGHKDVSPNQVLHGTRGLGAVSERNQLQLRGGDVLCLAGEPK